ncbi:phosphate acetyltransferase [Trueperella sp. LYQ143]|uniref:phosphate acetyltransferase n=1 Tax=unclassified Trueperella TaxID=2630174 RepID=UPI003983183D
MTKSVYFTAAEGNSGTRPVTHAVVAELKNSYPNLGIFRAFTNNSIDDDRDFLDLLDLVGRPEDRDIAWGTTHQAYIHDESAAMTELVTRYTEYARSCDAVLILGLLDGDPIYPGALARAGRAAAHLGTSVFLVISGAVRTDEQIVTLSHLAGKEIMTQHAPISAVAVTSAARNHATEPHSEHMPIMYFYDDEDATVGEADRHLLVSAMEHGSKVVTPLSFTASLIARAQAARKRIVLPESSDDRILLAANELIRRKVADIILLGESETVQGRAAELGLDLSQARIVSTKDPELVEKYAQELARLREKKGMTYDKARETLKDLSYFGTMMVHMNDADGMVSGAVNTTANTIVPSFQIIKTKPGASLVSSCFLMLMEDRVYVYGDCAVTTNPTPEQLASIAISSAETAQQFGIEPRVAMLSYSTGDSGKGPDVDAVIEATRLAREQRPDLLIEGPIQYDAAVDAKVAATKLPHSAVAGHATVFIFPSLNAGNIGYKAVQRSSGAVAVGPVLQGLNKPVNDLSRGALVEDIINTVAITAIQAQ